MKLSISQLVQGLLRNLPTRQREILTLRYGLTSGEAATLAEIGAKYSVTRERIRQLETLALRQVREQARTSAFPQFVNAVTSHLQKAGGVQNEEQLILAIAAMAGVKNPAASFVNAVRFLLEASGNAFQHRADDHFHTFWHLGDSHKEKAAVFIDNLHKELKTKRNAVAPTNPMYLHFVGISKKFAVGPFGEFGLAEWADVVPKTARDWAYVVLKKSKNPLHFTAIAEQVTELRGKKTNPQTIHNELIKDVAFVLVGKGTYGLKEYGYEPGTARDVIARLIKQGGPMRSRQIVNAVLQQRIFKENTVLINLQNKKYFQRLTDGRYTLREA